MHWTLVTLKACSPRWYRTKLFIKKILPASHQLFVKRSISQLIFTRSWPLNFLEVLILKCSSNDQLIASYFTTYWYYASGPMKNNSKIIVVVVVVVAWSLTFSRSWSRCQDPSTRTRSYLCLLLRISTFQPQDAFYCIVSSQFSNDWTRITTGWLI